MRRSSLFAVIAGALCVLLSGCLTTSPEVQAKKEEFIQTIPTCSGEKDCKAKWEAAQIWIVRNAGYKLQTVTDVLLQTYNPTQSSTSIAVQVVKEPMGGGQYRLVVSVYCDNSFACYPNRLDAALDFNRTVGAAMP